LRAPRVWLNKDSKLLQIKQTINMVNFIGNLINEIKMLAQFKATLRPLKLTRLLEKFDVVKKAPRYIRIKV
jgi:hypothetical protein